MKLEAGTLIGGYYTLHGPLERGAMGAVWVARDTRTRERVALKFLGQAATSEDALRRFRRETRALMHLAHPHVVKLLDHGLEGNAPFIAMELLDGETLRSLLARRRTLAPQEAVGLLRQAAAGLSAAHALGIVHRDVKPSNLFVCNERGHSSLKLIDFGIASGGALETSGQATTHGLIGSPAYMSPEQARGEHVDELADVWSLSAVAFELLTGREPFAAANVPETLKRICSGIPPKASAAASGLPAGMDALFERAFAARPAERFESAARLVEELSRLCARAPDRAASPLAAAPSPGRVTETTTRRIEADVRYMDEIHCLAWHENVQIILSLAQPSYEFMLKSGVELDALQRLRDGSAGSLVVINSDANPPDEQTRDYLKRELRRPGANVAVAHVVEGTGFRGAAVRSALNMIVLTIRAPFPIKIFGDVAAGAAWLTAELRARRGYGPDPDQLTQAVGELRSRFKGFSAG